MQRIFVFTLLISLLGVFLISCDGNFGLNYINWVYLVVEYPKDAELSLEYKIPGIGLEEFVSAKEIDEHSESVKEMFEALALDDEKEYRYFYLSTRGLGWYDYLDDRFNFEFGLNLKNLLILLGMLLMKNN